MAMQGDTTETTSLLELDRVAAVLADKRLRMVFQPVVELATAGHTGYEALARFDTLPHRSPDVWFTHAARAGLGAELEAEAVARGLAPIADLHEDLTMAVNVSPRTVCSPQLRRTLAGVDPARVVLEVTEHEAVDDRRMFNRCARRLRDHGFRLAVDDAGSGHADVARIAELAPDVVKIDRSLVRGVDLHPGRQERVATLVAVTESLHGMVIAEGVESEAAVHVLRGLGVTHGQGFLFGRPAPLADCRYLSAPSAS